MTVFQMLVIAGAFIVAGIAKGALGMGLPPIAISLMSFAVPLEDALALMVLPTLFTNVWQAIYGEGFAVLMRRFWTMSVTAIGGLLSVALGFGHLGSPHASGWVGVTLIIYAVLALAAWRPKVPRTTERWANPLVGLSSGAVAGFTGVAAVPFLPYMQSLDIHRHDLVQALGIQFLFIIGALTLALAWQGAVHLSNAIGGVVALAPTMAGVWLGQKIRHALSPKMFRRIFLVGMLANGLHMAHALL
jgi:uncharacterized protein